MELVTRYCPVCCTDHHDLRRCPGELVATEPERHGWRLTVGTPQGMQVYGVMVTKTDCGLWRARILTYPNVLWVVPGGTGTIKFIGKSAVEAERRAIAYVYDHCREKGIRIRKELEPVQPAPRSELRDYVTPSPATRVLRFLPIRFGPTHPTEVGGTANLSETGLFVITKDPLEINSRLRLQLDVRDTKFMLTGDVRWNNPNSITGRSPGMGVRLHLPPKPYAEYVRTIV